MKVTTTRIDPPEAFKPIKVEFTIETPEELSAWLAVSGYGGAVASSVRGSSHYKHTNERVIRDCVGHLYDPLYDPLYAHLKGN